MSFELILLETTLWALVSICLLMCLSQLFIESSASFIVTAGAMTYMFLKCSIELWKIIKNAQKEPDYLQRFDVLFELHIKYQFVEQSDRTLSCMKAGGRTALRSVSGRRPCVLLLLHSAEGKPAARKLAVDFLRVCMATVGSQKYEWWVQERLVMQGRRYSGLGDFWLFHSDVRTRLDDVGMMVIEDFHKVHPHAATVVVNSTQDISAYPGNKAVLVLLMKTGWLDEGLTGNMSPDLLALSAIERAFGHSLDEGSRSDLIRVVAEWPVLVSPGHAEPPLQL